jgi:predicted ATPase
MYALHHTSLMHLHYGRYETARALLHELDPLTEEKPAPVWNIAGLMQRGWLSALTGRNAEAIQTLTSGIVAWRSKTGTALYMPLYLSRLAEAYAASGKPSDAWNSIDEATTAIESTKDRWYEAEVYRVAGEISLSGSDTVKSTGIFRASTFGRSPTTSKILGTTRRNEHGAALARSGQAG